MNPNLPPPTPSLPARVALVLLGFYQRFITRPLHLVVGPWCGCRFTPTCSEYAVQAIRKHGFRRGSWLAARRLARCNPLFDGGVDEVP